MEPGLVILQSDRPERIALSCGGANRIVSIFYEGAWEDLLTQAGTIVLSQEFHIHSYSTDPTHDSLQEQREALIEALRKAGKRWNPKDSSTQLYLIHGKSKVYAGIDLAGTDLGKRPYKAYQRQPPLRGPLGWALWQCLGVSPNQKVWCPSILDGTVPIEAALIQAGISPWRYSLHSWASALSNEARKNLGEGNICACGIYAWSDQWPHISATKANAKLAGVAKGITFSKNTIGWADLKFEEKSFDLIGAHVVGASAHHPYAERHFEELCRQAAYLLHDGGKMGLISTSLVGFSAAAARHGLRKTDSQIWWMGKQDLSVEICQK